MVIFSVKFSSDFRHVFWLIIIYLEIEKDKLNFTGDTLNAYFI